MKSWSMQAACLAAATLAASAALAQVPKYTPDQEKAVQALLKQGCGADVLKAFAGKPDKEDKNDAAGDVILTRSYGENEIVVAEKEQKVLATFVRDAKAPEPFKKYLALDRATLEKQYGLPHIEYRLAESASYGSDTEVVSIRFENGKVQEVEWDCSAGGADDEQTGGQPSGQPAQTPGVQPGQPGQPAQPGGAGGQGGAGGGTPPR